MVSLERWRNLGWDGSWGSPCRPARWDFRLDGRLWGPISEAFCAEDLRGDGEANSLALTLVDWLDGYLYY